MSTTSSSTLAGRPASSATTAVPGSSTTSSATTMGTFPMVEVGGGVDVGAGVRARSTAATSRTSPGTSRAAGLALSPRQLGQLQGQVTPGRRPPPLPAVKGTMGGIETPRRDIWSPGFRSSAPPTPTPTTPTSRASTVAPGASTAANSTDAATAPEHIHAHTHLHDPEGIVFRADPRMRTCFEELPEGGDEVAALFGV